MFLRFSFNNWFLPASCALLWFKVYDYLELSFWFSRLTDFNKFGKSPAVIYLHRDFFSVFVCLFVCFCYFTSPFETLCVCVTSCDMVLQAIDTLYICCTYILLERSFAIHLNSFSLLCDFCLFVGSFKWMSHIL